MAGIYYLLFTTTTPFYTATYGFGPGIDGLTFLGLGIGFFSATLFGARFSNQIYIHVGFYFYALVANFD